MKKISLILTTTLLYLATFGQQTFTATSSEVYEYVNSEWKIISTYKDVNIPLHVMTRFIHVEAKENGYFLLSREAPVEINESSFEGFRYEAYDLKMEKKCIIDIVDSKTLTKISVVSIFYVDDGFGIRYYLVNE